LAVDLNVQAARVREKKCVEQALDFVNCNALVGNYLLLAHVEVILFVHYLRPATLSLHMKVLGLLVKFINLSIHNFLEFLFSWRPPLSLLDKVINPVL